jgi:NAD(P)-dependent dehydrogenase (short-subunit alcohol dehydrogenase family)
MNQNNERAISLNEKIIVVTGASRGLGRAVAIEFTARGAHVLGVGRDESALLETAHLAGAGFTAGTLDVRDEAAVTEYFAALPSLDVLINNAGIARIRPLLETSVEEMREMLEINVVAAFVVLREGARKMAQSGGGHIINIASDAATRGIEGMAPYVASKHALLGLSRSAHLELKRSRVRVSALCPGPIQTDILGTGTLPSGAIAPSALAKLIADLAETPPGLATPEILSLPA